MLEELWTTRETSFTKRVSGRLSGLLERSLSKRDGSVPFYRRGREGEFGGGG